MVDFFAKCNNWLGKNMFIVVLTGLWLGFSVNTLILLYCVKLL